MKKTILVLLISIPFLSFSQAFTKSDKILSLGLGPAAMIHIPVDYSGYNFLYTPITGQLTFKGEFGVHKYVGVGFETGLGGSVGNIYWNNELNVPLAALANFHFYQLIADKTGKNIHADKLDVYAGVKLGSGVGIHFSSYGNGLDALVVAGVHAGVRYYFKPNIAVNGEVGYGTTLVNAGMSFKLGK